MTEEIKKEILSGAEKPILETGGTGNGKDVKPEPPVTDFKIAEIWIREGQLMLDATPEFWRDKFRARGIIAYLDDIVRDAKVPSDKPRIIQPKGSFLNGIRGLWRGKK